MKELGPREVNCSKLTKLIIGQLDCLMLAWLQSSFFNFIVHCLLFSHLYFLFHAYHFYIKFFFLWLTFIYIDRSSKHFFPLNITFRWTDTGKESGKTWGEGQEIKHSSFKNFCFFKMNFCKGFYFIFIVNCSFQRITKLRTFKTTLLQDLATQYKICGIDTKYMVIIRIIFNSWVCWEMVFKFPLSNISHCTEC